MNEEPKSIWKKSWSGPQWLRAWAILAAATFVIIFVVTLFLPGGPHGLSDWAGALAVLMAISLVIATVFAGLWLLFGCLFNRRNFKRLLFGLACFITLVALFYAEEDFRGKRAWNNFKREWQAKGEKFELAAFIPPPVPDDQNFAMTPLLRPIFDFYQSTNGIRWHDTNAYAHLEHLGVYAGSSRESQEPGLGNLEAGKFTELEAWRNYYRSNTNFPHSSIPTNASAEILTALGKFDDQMEELRTAAARSGSRFPIHYDDQPPFGILLPHLAHIKRLSQLFILRSVVLSELGRGEEALADVQMGFRVSDSISDEPFLIDHLVRLASLSISLQGLREGLVRHAWNETQLHRLETYLGSLDILAEAGHNMRGERSLNLAGLEYYRRMGFRGQPDEMVFMGDDGGAQNSPSFLRGFRVFPSGFSYQNMLTIARLHQEFTLGAIDEKRHRVFPDIANGLTNAITRMRVTPYNLFGKMLMPAFARSSMKSARTQTFVDMASIACALERYRLANQRLPDELDALAPQFIGRIPTDVIDGKPLRYRKNSDGSYVLYSIGWNQTDDGGVRAQSKGTSGDSEKKPEDWVWQMPAN